VVADVLRPPAVTVGDLSSSAYHPLFPSAQTVPYAHAYVRPLAAPGTAGVHQYRMAAELKTIPAETPGMGSMLSVLHPSGALRRERFGLGGLAIRALTFLNNDERDSCRGELWFKYESFVIGMQRTAFEMLPLFLRMESNRRP
jgi:hypothetical protein